MSAPESVRAIYKPRSVDSHKGTHGHALLIAGFPGKVGAAVLCANGCLRSGAGLTTVNIPFSERAILQTALPEAMLTFREEEIDWKKYAAAGIGPGTGVDVKSILREVLEHSDLPAVIDADAITILSESKKLKNKLRPGLILTPHPKEFDRVFGDHMSREAQMKKARDVAASTGAVILLKGERTFITTGDEDYTNPSGNAGLAKGGSGDLLTGMITALLAAGYQPYDAARLGAYLHGVAADIAVLQQSEESLLASDVAGCIGRAFQSISV